MVFPLSKSEASRCFCGCSSWRELPDRVTRTLMMSSLTMMEVRVIVTVVTAMEVLMVRVGEDGGIWLL